MDFNWKCEIKASATRRNPFRVRNFFEENFFYILPSLGVVSKVSSPQWPQLHVLTSLAAQPQFPFSVFETGFVTDGTGVANDFVMKSCVFRWSS